MSGVWWVKDEELNAEQKGVINLHPDKSYLVIGPPGSGKTNLLLLRAKYLILAKKPNLVILSFTRSLGGFMSTGAFGYKVPPDRIRTSISWLMGLLYENGVKVDTDGLEFREARRKLIEEAQDVVQKRKLKNLYHSILLDEAQDYVKEELDLCRRLARTVFAVADSRQRIYSKSDHTDYLASVVDKSVTLKYHYRNGQEICKLADAIGAGYEDYLPMLPTANYDENARPSKVEPWPLASLEEQITKALEQLALQMKAYPGEMLAIVTPLVDSLEKVWQAVKTSPLKAHSFCLSGPDQDNFDTKKQICVCTLHAAKGLEFRAVHIVGADQIKRFPNQRNLAYMAVTRAKTSLSIYYSGSLPSFLDGAIEGIQPPSKLPQVKDVFGV
jgi:superfamily I DNA/RNA helicase